MMMFRKHVSRFVADTRGSTAIEYSVIAAGIACAIVTVVALTGTKVGDLWTTIRDAFG